MPVLISRTCPHCKRAYTDTADAPLPHCSRLTCAAAHDAAQQRADRLAEMEAYPAKHVRCPKCGGRDIEQTCAGILALHGPYRDTNRARCGCGWVGIVDDLLPPAE